MVYKSVQTQRQQICSQEGKIKDNWSWSLFLLIFDFLKKDLFGLRALTANITRIQ
jgi:hypothetical protein